MNDSLSLLPATRPGGRLLATVCTGGLLLSSAFLQAENDDPDVTLDPVSVTALRFEQPKSEVPSNITVIDHEDIIRSGATNLPEILRDRANMHFSSLSGPGSASLDARGFGTSSMQNTLIIVDGRVVTRPDIGSFNWTQFPLESIESVEVLKGAHTALYGDRASGSVIKITTRKGSEERQSAIQGSYGSFQTENLRLSTSGQVDQLGYTVGADYFSTDGYRDFSNQRNRSANLGLDFQATEDLSVYGSFNYLQSDYNLPGGINEQQFQDDPQQSGSFLSTFEERYLNLAGGLLAEDTGYGIFRLEGGGVFLQLDKRNNFGCFTDNDLDTFTVSPTWTMEQGDNTFLLGLDFIRDELDVQGDTGFNSYEADLVRNRYAIFGQLTRHFTENWIGSVSGRHETARLRVDYEDSDPAESYQDSTRDNEQAFGLGLTHLINENARAWIRFEHYYRYPSTDEIAGYQGGNAFLATNFNSDLKPESGQTIEIGGDLTYENWFFSVNPFVTRVKDEIFFDSTASLNTNFDHRTLRYGSEFAIRYDESQWGVGVQYRYLRGEERGGSSKGQRIAIIPEHLLQTTLTLRPTDILTVNFNARYRGRFDSANGGLGQQDSNPSGDLRRIGGSTIFGIDARLAVNSDLEIFTSLDNLTDKRYTNFIETSSAAFGADAYYPEDGRALSIGARYRF
ncbi:MAG: TonB-dependent receptor [Opitutales bacterium]|nr:TonB-dependent receptor [Opitutales bacterium]